MRLHSAGIHLTRIGECPKATNPLHLAGEANPHPALVMNIVYVPGGHPLHALPHHCAGLCDVGCDSFGSVQVHRKGDQFEF